MNAPNITAARRFVDRWREPHPKAVECLRDDPDDLPARFRYPTPDERKPVRTTNAIERRFREGPAADPANGRLPGPHLNGARPLRHLLISEQERPNRHPFYRDA